MKAFLISLLLVNSAFGLSVLSKGKRYKGVNVIKKIDDSVSITFSANEKEKMKKETNSQLLGLKSYLSSKPSKKVSRAKKKKQVRRFRVPIFKGSKKVIRSLTMIEGEILQSVRIFQGRRKYIHEVYPLNNKLLPRGTQFECQGSSVINAISIECGRMITKNKDYSVEVILKDSFSGDELILADHVFDPEDFSITQAIAASIFGKSLELKQKKVLGNDSEIVLTNERNLLLGAGIGAADRIVQKIEKDAGKHRMILSLNPRKKVLIVFRKEVEL